MKISVIIPTYRPKEYLWECFESLEKQAFPKKDFEVILVLNGCTEPWKSEIESYIASEMQDMNVKFIHTEQGGVSNARNIGLDNAKGEYITFIDDDDFVSPCYLQELYSKANPSTVSLCYPLSFEDGSSKYKTFYITKDYNSNKAFHYPWITARRYFNGPVYKLIHRDIIGDRRFDIRFTHGEDSLFMFLISDRLKWISFTSKHAIYYRRIRMGSAMMCEQNLFKKIENEWNLFLVRSSLFFSHPQRYSFKYYLRCILSSVAKIIQ